MPLSKLNKEQYKAATAPFGKNLIIASAGTGKTSTIVARIGYLLKQGIKPEELLLLTFTNKASYEMIQRVARYFDDNLAKKIEAGTFHAVSYRILNKIGKNITLKMPKELKLLLKSIYQKRDFSFYEVNPYAPSTLYDLYSLYTNKVVDKSFGDWLASYNLEHAELCEIYEDIMLEFIELKKEFGYVDFNDLLIDFREYAKEQEIHFKEILVDEYQDTNRLQESLIESIESDSLFCVGDYDQSIYGFNGADISIIGNFSQKYPNAKVFSLNKNYRSSAPILHLANKVIEKNPRLYPKKLEVTRMGNFPPPTLLVFDDLYSQYQAIASKIKVSLTPKSDIAVIFRNNASADGIEAHLREQGISSKRKGGISFFETREVKAMLDMFTLLINPKDIMAFIHIFEYAKGIGSAFAKDIFDALLKVGDGSIIKGILTPKDEQNPFKKNAVNQQLGLFDDIFEEESVGRFKNKNYDKAFMKNPILKNSKITNNIADFLYAFYQFVSSTYHEDNPTKIIEKISSSKLFEYISEYLATQRVRQKDGSIDELHKQEAKDNIKRKALLLKDLSKAYKDKYRFINALTLSGGEISEGEGVNLLSVHASKGLEFSEVYVVDLMDGRFPNRKLMSKNGGDLEEERRLFYVAVTRAKDRLYLSYAKYDRVKKIDYIHSLFLVEAGLIKEE